MSDMTPEQIDAALAAGIISEDQARALRSKSVPDVSATSNVAVIGNEDDMRFVRSFADVFISIGIGLFMLGLSGLSALFGGDLAFLGIAAIIWAMAEYFGRKKRAHLPTLICALAFLFFATAGLFALFEAIGLKSEILASLTASLVMFAFYWRIRLPFCIMLIAISLLLFVFTLLNRVADDLLIGNFGWIILLSGLTIFGVALWYDTQDKHRTTRFSDNAFWLHFLAAPLIIHGLVIELLSLKTERVFNVVPVVTIDQADAWIMMFMVVCLGLVALVINRRALLVSSLGYAGFAIGFLMQDTGLDIGWVVTSTFLLLGGGIIFLGVGWHATRNLLIKFLPDWPVFPPPYDSSYKAQVEAARAAQKKA